MRTLFLGHLILIGILHGMFSTTVANLIGTGLSLGVALVAMIVAHREGNLELPWEPVDD